MSLMFPPSGSARGEWSWRPRSPFACCLGALDRHLDGRRAADGLIDDTVAFGEFAKLIELLFRRIGVDLEGETDRGKSDRYLLGNPERSAERETPCGADTAQARRNPHRGGPRLRGTAGKSH